MKKKNCLLAFASWFSLLAAVTASSIIPIAAQRTVGVNEGDWFEYGNVEFNWTSNDPNARFPPEWEGFEEINGTEWMRNTVQGISGTNITGQTIVHYTNGTEITEGYEIDVDTGRGNGTILFIAANLGEGDLVYTDPTAFIEGATINETISRAYLGETVEVNHLNITMEVEWTGVFHFIWRMNFYWFKSSGALCEFQLYYYNWTSGAITPPEEMPQSVSSVQQYYESSLEVSIVIIGMVPEFSTWASLTLILAVLTFVAVIYKRKVYGKKSFSQ